jgi:hypothetical protein
MAAMTIKKTNLPTPLDYVEEAFIDCILNMSESEIDAELRDLNLDPEKVAAETKAAIERGIVATNKASLVRARDELAKAKTSLSSSSAPRDRTGALARFEKMKNGDHDLSNRMMMAARKGEGLSENDIEGVLDDLDDLEKLTKDVDPE